MTNDSALDDAGAKPPRPPVRKEAPRRVKRLGPDLVEFRRWLANLGMAATPSVHVNGYSHPGAVLVVDFGSPFKQPKLTAEQNAELVNRLRDAARALSPREVKTSVSSDGPAGIWWVSIT